MYIHITRLIIIYIGKSIITLTGLNVKISARLSESSFISNHHCCGFDTADYGVVFEFLKMHQI